MSTQKEIPVSRETVVEHFTARAERYNNSSHWCTDPELRAFVLGHLEPATTDDVLDVACGTGLVSAWFHGNVNKLVGADITRAMFDQAAQFTDEMVVAPGEELPFEDNTFDLAICRQGIQFMDAPAAVAEMVRVVKPGGKVCIINLCAYGAVDEEETFEIQRLRNPARRNFFFREDLQNLLDSAGCSSAHVHDWLSDENVEIWSDNGAIANERIEGIRDIYRNASGRFRDLHRVRETENGFIDRMIFGVAIGVK